MASTIDTTVSGASANSYVTLADAMTYFGDRFNGGDWGNDDDLQARALLTACARMQDENWLGSRSTATQALAWPRVRVKRPDDVGWQYGLQAYYAQDEIPQRIKDAQCEWALWILTQNRKAGQPARRVKSWSADGISATYEYGGAIETMPEDVSRLIAMLIADVQLRRG